MSDFYSPRLGLQPETREQMLLRMYQHVYTQGLFTEDFNSFLGSNWHRFLSSSVLPMLEEQQANFFEAQAKLFSFWHDHHLAVRGGLGSSYEGILNAFRPYCTGLNLVNYSQDSSLGSAGNMALYFDNLVLHDQVEQQELLRSLFRKVMPIAIFTPQGDYQLEVDFTGTNSKVYQYFHLLPEHYDALDVRIHVSYKAGAVAYPVQSIVDSVRAQFDLTNRIGRGFYPTAYFDHELLPNLSQMLVEWSLENTTNWSSNNLEAKFGQKYIIKSAVVV